MATSYSVFHLGSQVGISERVQVGPDAHHYVREMFSVCDDCRSAYPLPAYLTFDPDDCTDDEDPHRGCTGNMCPDCAGPYLVPDDPKDPRKPDA